MFPAAVFHGILMKPAFGLDPEVTPLYCTFSWRHYFFLSIRIINFKISQSTFFQYLNSDFNVLFFQKRFEVRNTDLFIMKQARSQCRISAGSEDICKMLHASRATTGNYRY